MRKNGGEFRAESAHFVLSTFLLHYIHGTRLTPALLRVLAGLPLPEGAVRVVQHRAPGPVRVAGPFHACAVHLVAEAERENARPAVLGQAAVQLVVVAWSKTISLKKPELFGMFFRPLQFPWHSPHRVPTFPLWSTPVAHQGLWWPSRVHWVYVLFLKMKGNWQIF